MFWRIGVKPRFAERFEKDLDLIENLGIDVNEYIEDYNLYNGCVCIGESGIENGGEYNDLRRFHESYISQMEIIAENFMLLYNRID